MKVTLEFNEDEQEKARVALDAQNYYCVCQSFSYDLYRLNKHGEIVPDEYLQKIIKLWNDCGGDVLEFNI